MIELLAGEVQVKEKVFGREVLCMLAKIADEAAVAMHGDFMQAINPLFAVSQPLGFEFVLVNELESADMFFFLLVPMPEGALGDVEPFGNLSEAHALHPQFDELLSLVDGMHNF